MKNIPDKRAKRVMRGGIGKEMRSQFPPPRSLFPVPPSHFPLPSSCIISVACGMVSREKTKEKKKKKKMQSQEKMKDKFRQNGQNGSAGNGHVDKVINISSRTRASAHTHAEAVHTVVNTPGTVVRQDLINSCGSYTPGARAYTYTRTRVKDPEAYTRALRIAKFGGDFNPVEEVVKEAIKAFKPARPEIDARVWLKIANRIGYSNFLDCVWQQQALFEEWQASGKHYANKAAIFQRLFNKRFPKSKGGAK